MNHQPIPAGKSANILILIANLLVLAMSMKLYTEYFKDRSISARKP